MKDFDEDDTCEYSNKVTWVFNQPKSGPGLTEDMVITFPHAMILSLIMSVMREKPGMIGLAGTVID